ncbi:helix-turn-helix domain-containing protein [Sphaerisporangium viridialbum]|uniref:helix-turn-helix domain-containing protein n=1 Tax=Sphaerisporangium viridialbum TaxID=46189 RepID=UPI003C7174E4
MVDTGGKQPPRAVADIAGRRLLEGLGVTGAEEGAYRALLRHGPATLTELASEAEASVAGLRRMLPRLEDLGLVARLAGRPLRLIATPPHLAVDALAARRQEEIAHSRAASALLAAEVADRPGPQPEELVEVVIGQAAVARRYLQIERNATEEMLVLVHPPYAVDLDLGEDERPPALGSRVRTRGIYGPRAFEEPGLYAHTRRSVADGEQARVGHVPMKLAVADGRTAILPLGSEEDRAVESALVVHPSALLDALVGLFEVLWRAATPLPVGPLPPAPGEPLASLAPVAALDRFDADVLALLTAGLKDDAIARQLDISLRTVQRRVRTLCDHLGADTRFQAGLFAARQNLLDG